MKYLDGISDAGHRRAQHPDRDSAGLRAGRGAGADSALLPGGSGGGAARGRGGRADRRVRPRTSTGRLPASTRLLFLSASSAEIRSDLRKRRSLALISSADARGRLAARAASCAAAFVAIDEADDGFERDSHVEAGRARLLAARFDARIVGDGGGDRFGQFPRQLVHERIHADLHAAAEPGDSGRDQRHVTRLRAKCRIATAGNDRT